jgi:hypothetical protein
MADSFYATTSYRTIKVIPPNSVLEIEYVSCATIPTGITFAYGVPYDGWQGGTGPGIGLLDSIAVQLEQLVSNLDVVGGQATQDLDNNGTLADFVDLYVQYDRSAQGLPPLQETVTVNVNDFLTSETGIGGLVIPPSGGVTPTEAVQAAIARLEQLAAS